MLKSKAAERGDGKAWAKVGNFFYSGLGVEKKNLAMAKECYQKGAKLNDPTALNSLG